MRLAVGTGWEVNTGRLHNYFWNTVLLGLFKHMDKHLQSQITVIPADKNTATDKMGFFP